MRIRIDDLAGPERRRDTGGFVPWRLVSPRDNESCRWQCTDGRWVALTLGHGEELGSVIVSDSNGRRECVDSYEGALTLAKHWRT